MNTWLPIVPAALAAVAAAGITAIVVADGLGWKMFDELLRDARERTRANGWDSVAAFAPIDDSKDNPARVSSVREGAFEAALAAAVADAKAHTNDELTRIAEELARVRQEAEEQLTAARLDHETVVRDLRAAADEVVRVRQEADRTLTVRLEKARAEILADAEARIAEARKVADAALAAAADAQSVEAAAIRQDAANTLAQALMEARAEGGREREAAVHQVTIAAEGEIERMKQAAEQAMAARVEAVQAEAAREREAAVHQAEAAAVDEIAVARREAEAALAAAAVTVAVLAASTADADRSAPASAEPELATSTSGRQTIEEYLKEARAKIPGYPVAIDRQENIKSLDVVR